MPCPELKDCPEIPSLTLAKATVNEIHVSGQGITLQLMRVGGIHYSL